jgi:hypothetical protein
MEGMIVKDLNKENWFHTKKIVVSEFTLCNLFTRSVYFTKKRKITLNIKLLNYKLSLNRG